MVDRKKIEETIAAYVEGVKEFDFAKAESAWFKNGLKIAYNGEIGGLESIKMLDSRPPESIKNLDITQEAKIELIDVTNTVAIVKLHWVQVFSNKKKEYVDYLSLLKNNTQWKIAVKISTTRVDEV